MTRASRIAAVGYEPPAESMEAVETCNLCGGERFVELARQDRYGYRVPLCACLRCGLAFLSKRPSAPAYGDFYESVYRPLVSAYHGRLIDAETVQVEQREYADQLISFLDRALDSPPVSVLDIGGSTGVVAAAARDAWGCRATVIDPSPAELDVARRAGMETVEGLMEEFDPGGRQWDLVLLCQTIDHLLDVAATLRAIRSVLAPDGRAFVDVLDVLWVLARTGTIEASYKIDHPYYLTRATALAYFARAGLEVVAERMADDGHWGFVLAPADPRPDALPAAGGELLYEVWRRRAEAS